MNWNTQLPPEEPDLNKPDCVVQSLPQVMQEASNRARKKQMNPSVTFYFSDGAWTMRDVGPVKNGINKELCNGMSHYERDCMTLLEVILTTKVHVQPSKLGEFCSFFERYIKPLSRKYRDSLQSSTENKVGTVTLTVDLLCLLQNAICREFDHLITVAQGAFAAPEQDVSLIYDLVKLSEENFPLEKCQQLHYRLKAEICFVEQSEEFSGNSIEVKSEDENETCTLNLQCVGDEQFDESLVSVGSIWICLTPSNARAMPDNPPRRSPSVSEEVSIELTENSYREEYASARPLSDSSTKLQADSDEMPSSKGLLSREDHYDTETVVVDYGIDHSYQEFKQSEQLNCTCLCCQKNSIVVSQWQRSNDIINAANSQLQDDIAAYQDRCSKQEDEISQLKEKLTQMEELKQRLEAEVGRQLFLESKERRRKLLNKHPHEQSMLGTTRGASSEGELLHDAGSMDRSEQITTWCNENGALTEGDSSFCPEGNQVNEVPESSYNEADEIFDESEEHREGNETTEIDEQAPICSCSIGNTFYSDGDVTLSNLNADNLPESSSIRDISNSRLSNESCGSVSSLSQSSTNSANNLQPSTGDSNLCSITAPLNFDQAVKAWESSGEDNQERYLLSFLENRQFENEEMKGGCAAKGEREREDLDSYNSFCDGDLVDGSVSIPNRTQSSLKLVEVDVANVNQGPFAHRDTTQKQNLSVVRVTDQIDTVVDQSDCHTSNQSSKWEHLGARPRDRPSKGNRSSECSSLCFSSLDPVPQQIAGVANAFLARHSEDKHLHESLYYTYAEEMLAKDFSSQGACDSHVEGITISNKEKLYLGDFQVTSRPDPPYYPPYSSVFPLTVGASIRGNGEDGNPYHNTLNGNSVLLPGPLYSYIGGNTNTNSNFNSFDPNFLASDIKEPRLLQHDQFSSLCSSDILQSGFTGSRLTPDFLGTTGPQMTHSVIGLQSNIGFTRTTSALPLEPLQMQTPSTSNLGLLATSTSNTQSYSHQPNASTDFQTLSSVAMANQSDSRLLSELEFGGNTHLSPVSSSSIRDGVNISGRRNSSSILNTIGDHLAFGTYREGNSTGNSSSSCITSGANTGGDHDENSAQSGGSIPNENYGTESVESTDNSLLELEQHVEEACAMVERVLREREEREEFGREIERKEREIRAERARKKREREARELEEARGWPQQQEPVTGQSLWLCEHYQRHCRVRFPCCTNFYSCHRCHNNSKECDNEEAKASHATHLKCSYCHHEQEIAEDSAKCRSCGAKMSAYFCGICKHFTSIDKNPYHCDKCGICRIHKDKSFHCDVCNVCLDKRLQGKHKCRPDSGHDECCICLEDAFSGCQILPCSHKVHRECAIAMIQNGIRTCPVCRHPLYSPAPQ